MHPTFTWPASPLIPRPESGFYGTPDESGCVQTWANAEVDAELRLLARNGDARTKRYAKASLALLPLEDQVCDVPVDPDSAAAQAVSKGTPAQRFLQGGAGGLPALNADGEPAHPADKLGHEVAVAWPDNVKIADDSLLAAKRAWVQRNFDRGVDGTKTGTNADQGL